MIGNVKLIFNDKGYGFISVRNQPHDIYFKTKDVIGNRALRIGDCVEVEAYRSGPGKVTARKVVLQSADTSAKMKSQDQRHARQRPYYGKPTEVKEAGSTVGTVVAGAVIGSLFGPVGAVIGAIVGASGRESTRPVSQICLKCGGTGHVTAITTSHIGFQCERCRSFWKQRNKEGLKASELTPPEK